MPIVSFQLSDYDNYMLWSRVALNMLMVKNKLGFIDITFMGPSLVPKQHAKWDRCNVVVRSWIMASVTPDIVSRVFYISTTAQIWEDLSERFDKVDGARVFHVHRDICTIQQGSLNIFAYFTKLRKLWDEFGAMPDLLDCKCGRLDKFIRIQENIHLFQILMGLNESYHVVRGNLLLRSPLPTVKQAYALLLQEESHRIVSGLLPDPM